jgi:hypothetical protein
MMRVYQIAAVTGILLAAAPVVSALELRPGNNVPADYAMAVETTDKDGKKVTQYTFATAPSTISPAQLNSILAAYGLALREPGKAPVGYATEVEATDKDGKKVKQHVFGATPSTVSDHDLNQILVAYGVKLADAKKAPDGYAREVETKGEDGKVVKSHSFSSTPRTISGAELHRILQAYQ